MGFTAVLAGVFAAAMPAALIMNERLLRLLERHDAPPESIWVVISVVALSGLSAGLGFFFFRHLYRIVASVEGGDPFVPANARRLQFMGWIAIAVHVLGIPLAMTSRWLDRIFGRPHDGFELSYFAILLALVLFVLARVFREGARLREEVEGTV